VAPRFEDMASSPIVAVTDPADAMFAWCRTMLDTQPIHRDDKHQWQVFTYADVTRVLSDPVTFSSDTIASISREPDIERFFMDNIVTMDPPRHRKLRTLINQAFTPRMVAALAPRITEITISLLDAVHGVDRFDFVDSIAYPLSATVITELLGMSAQDLPRVYAWFEVLVNQQTVDATTVPGKDEEQLVNELAPTMRDMNEYLLAHTRRHRQQPTDDLIGRLITAEIDGERLIDEQIAGVASMLLIAGHVTTTAMLSSAVFSFCRHPEAAAAVRADRDLVPAAIEEVLRYRPPFPRMIRITTTDTEIGGHAIPAGQLVIAWIAAANRDTARFPNPDRFNVHRTSTGQLAFGHGIHFCIGAPLARLEAKIALNILLDRYRDVTIDTASPIEYPNPWLITSLTRLPVLVT
jgi:cytochrome P450